MSDGQLYIPVKQLAELRHKIREAKRQMDIKADKSGLPEDLFANLILPILKAYQPILSTLASHNSDLIYRARKCVDDKPFGSIGDLYNPPTPSGRALATKKLPILYGSSSIQTCLSEINVKIGEIVNIAAFKYTNIMDGQFWFIGQLGTYYKSQEQSRYLSDEKTVQRPFFVDKQEATRSLVFMDLLINEIFSVLSSDLDDYVLNGLLIDAIRKKQPKVKDFNGVLFVSTKDAPGMNFAVYGEAIRKLEPLIVNLVKITDIDIYGCVGYELIKNAKPKEDGSLEWPEI